jgi:hypothetical protein
MVVILLLCVAAVLLYFWLIGHWFARALAFFAWGAAFELLAVASYYGKHDDSAWPLIWLACAAAAAWFVSGIPQYYWRRKARVIARHGAPLRPYPQH